METNSLFVEMDALLQFYASPFDSWQKTSSFMPERRVNNVLKLYIELTLGPSDLYLGVSFTRSCYCTALYRYAPPDRLSLQY